MSDTLVLPSLLDRVEVPIGPLFADAGYLSSRNVHVIVAKGGTPYVRPRSNTKGRPPRGTKDKPSSRTSEPFRDMIDQYNQHREKWLSTYHARNGIESAWSGVKRRFTGAVAAASAKARRVEAALKLLVWNVTRMVRLGGAQIRRI